MFEYVHSRLPLKRVSELTETMAAFCPNNPASGQKKAHPPKGCLLHTYEPVLDMGSLLSLLVPAEKLELVLLLVPNRQ